jgi:hypothetical protein
MKRGGVTPRLTPATLARFGSKMQLAGVDTNLIIALRALLLHQNVTRAAKQVGPQAGPGLGRAHSGR